jgi:hypothetical protein
MAREFDSGDAGTSVLDANGNPVGTIEGVEGGMATVRRDSDIDRKTSERLGWSDDDETHELDTDQLQSVDTDEVRLREM